jgi:hypothetical protein
MATVTLTLTEFLLARIAEDECFAQAVSDGNITVLVECGVTDTSTVLDADWGPMGSPTRSVAECEARRRIVEIASPRGLALKHRPRLRRGRWDGLCRCAHRGGGVLLGSGASLRGSFMSYRLDSV